eukprot:TRINITY_DN3829_c0_g1_i1.p1 TRINITY_DN3829_c0_g1~~TRINITY_DN3829_c0_g1_i1.p1  ORF type:complete len:454 (-),score=159.13 TRINITY_DN3829_c0_g1_i1:48-1325(-)
MEEEGTLSKGSRDTRKEHGIYEELHQIRQEEVKDLKAVSAETHPLEISKEEELILREEERPISELLQNISNFRDVGENCNKDSGEQIMKADTLFRSARLDDATTKDIELIIKRYKIHTIIDLRAETEGRMGDEEVNTFPASAINSGLAIAAAQGLAPSKDQPHYKREIHAKKERNQHEDDTGHTVTYYINFAGTNFRYWSIWNPLPFRMKLKTIKLMATRHKPEAVEMIGHQMIEPRGLIGLYYDFVDYCGAEMVEALRIMSNAKRYPLLVHCTQGKDRTGLVIALALGICDVPDRLILLDYARTQEGLKLQRALMEEEMRKTGLSSQFVDAPPEIMERTLSYIREKYGSIYQYLSLHGLTVEMMRDLRNCLMVKATPYEWVSEKQDTVKLTGGMLGIAAGQQHRYEFTLPKKPIGISSSNEDSL